MKAAARKSARAGRQWLGSRRSRSIPALVGVVAVGVLLVAVAPAFGAESPWWQLDFRSAPTYLPPGGEGRMEMTAADIGDQSVNASQSPVVLTDKLPPGVTAIAIEETFVNFGFNLQSHYRSEPMSCGALPATTLRCTWEGPERLPPYEVLFVRFRVKVAPDARSGEANEVKVEGGEGYRCSKVQPGAGQFVDSFCGLPDKGTGEFEGEGTGVAVPQASLRRPVTVSGAPVPFGLEAFSQVSENEGGSTDTQAGSHPFQLTSAIAFNQRSLVDEPPALVKNVRVKLPPGLIGNPTTLPECSDEDFNTIANGPHNLCPLDTVIGVASSVVTVGGNHYSPLTAFSPIYNLAPRVGEPARFGFLALNVPITLDTAVRSGEDYGVTVSSSNISEYVSIISSRLTFWGVPGDPRHDDARGVGCLTDKLYGEGADGEEKVPCEYPEESNPQPFLVMPTGCTGPLPITAEMDSWSGTTAAPLTSVLADGAGTPVAMDGCNKLPFDPDVTDTPDGRAASTPTGLTVAIHVPQEASLNPTGLSPSAVRESVVTLPEGMQISPTAADELLACSDEQIGFTGFAGSTGVAQFTPGVVGCPDASKIGTVEIKTPLLPEPLEGAVYLAAQDANPFGSLIGLYLVAENANEGVSVKLPGEVRLNERTGQIVTVFPNSPDVTFEEAKLHFFGSDRAPLSTPASCGSYTSTASIAPWSGNPPSSSTSTFDITSGPDETPCASPRPFQPGFEGGTTSVQAGGFTPLTLTMSRPDADQQLGKLSVVFPPGISAGLRGVKLCEEPQAATGQCPAESQIGQVIVSVGLGGDPFSVEDGKAYITGPYEGDPFGVDVVVPAVAGPFNLGTEVVRAKVDVDPTDAHLTVVSDAFPTILDGIPLQLQHVNVTVNRPGFVFNPTSCEPMKLTGELESIEGATANVSTPFQVTNCAALSFKPEFKVQTSAKTSRTEGASLHVNLTLPSGAQGTKANVAKVKVSLPKQLPSPLKTLQKACTEKVFAENPGDCPKASKVGEATVSTPVLEGPLSGPAYFVSHGGAKYPELMMVLVGEDGVTVQVHGETFISKQGITTATFSTVPDVPFSTFELTLPEREYPALSANGNLCKGTLIMPTEITGQNGLKINQETKISVTGCPKIKKAAKKASHKRKKTHRKALKGQGGGKRKG